MLRLDGEDNVPSVVRFVSVDNNGGALKPIESEPAGSVV